MGIFDEFKRLAHPYEDEEEDDYDDFDISPRPVERRERDRMDRPARSSDTGYNPPLLSSPAMLTSRRMSWTTPSFPAWASTAWSRRGESTDWIRSTRPTTCRTLLVWRRPMKWTAGEESKGGCAPADLPWLAEEAQKAAHIRLRGLRRTGRPPPGAAQRRRRRRQSAPAQPLRFGTDP